jgi:hypothetical protein
MKTGDLVTYRFLAAFSQRGAPTLGIILYERKEMLDGFHYFQVLLCGGKSKIIYGEYLTLVG